MNNADYIYVDKIKSPIILLPIVYAYNFFNYFNR